MGPQRKRLSDTDDTAEVGLEDYVPLCMHFLNLVQTLSKHTQGGAEVLCQELVRTTQGKARLLLSCQEAAVERFFPVSVSFPVQFRDRTYGTLFIIPHPAYPTSPALPLSVAHLLAHICGWLLYTIELSAFIEGQCRQLDRQIPEHLTKREREVLALICRGCDQQTISTILCIAPATVDTHRKRIYEKLGVHCERDLPLAAYQAQLFSIFDKPSTDAPSPPISRST